MSDASESTVHIGREHIAKLAEEAGEYLFAREVRAGCWDHRSDVALAIARQATLNRDGAEG